MSMKNMNGRVQTYNTIVLGSLSNGEGLRLEGK